MTASDELVWPTAMAPAALACLVGGAGDGPGPGSEDDAEAGLVVDRAARAAGVVAETSFVDPSALHRTMHRTNPCLIRVPERNEATPAGLIAVARVGRRRVRLVRPNGSVARVRPDALVDLFVTSDPAGDAAGDALAAAGASTRARARVRTAMKRRRAADVAVPCWRIWPADATRWRTVARRAGAPRWAALFVVAAAAEYAAWLTAWAAAGSAAINGGFPPGGVVLFAAALAALVPLRVAATWTANRLAVAAGGVLKRRLMAGTLRLRSEEVRHEGSGGHLGRALECEAVETLAVNGGLVAAIGAVELVAAAVVLVFSEGGVPLLAGLLAWTAVTGAIVRRLARARSTWTAGRRSLTSHLVEAMVGHRTRLAQGLPDERAAEDEAALSAYDARSRPMDRRTALLRGLVPGGWLVLGTVLLAPRIVTGVSSAAAVAAALGGLLLAARAFSGLTDGVTDVLGAGIAWTQVRPLSQAAARPDDPPPGGGSEPGPPTVLAARGIGFAYDSGDRRVLDGVDLELHEGDRLLLEGGSGSGKTTLTSVLAGLQSATAGHLALSGFDPGRDCASDWRRRVVLAPQFGDNHVLQSSWAFNALLGRGWPPRVADLAAADALCRDLGLGDVVDRMPAGLDQQVGETGWQLSHGERSRLFIARALLQDPDVVILDESFAALDPATLACCLDTARRHARTLVVVAHP